MADTYQNGQKFTEPLPQMLAQLKQRIETNKASMLLIDGPLGSGKTTLGVLIADYYQGSPIDLRNQIAMGGEELLKKLQWCYENGKKVLIYDESSDYARRGALTKHNATLNRVFDIYRAFGILIIMICPSVFVIDGNLYQKGIVRALIHCQERDKTGGNFKVFSLTDIYYLIHYSQKTVVKNGVYGFTRCRFYGHFKNLDSERATRLSEISTRSKVGVLAGSVIKSTGAANTKEIAAEMNVTTSTIQSYIKKMKLRPEQIQGKQRYFCKEDIARLKAQYAKNHELMT